MRIDLLSKLELFKCIAWRKNLAIICSFCLATVSYKHNMNFIYRWWKHELSCSTGEKYTFLHGYLFNLFFHYELNTTQSHFIIEIQQVREFFLISQPVDTLLYNLLSRVHVSLSLSLSLYLSIYLSIYLYIHEDQ